MTFFSAAILQIIGALALALFSYLIGKKTTVVHKKETSFWKWVILISTIAMWYGVILFLSHLSTGGLKDPITGAGLTLAVLGKICSWVGKVFR